MRLANEFAIHVVCYWIGNSSVIAAKHYLQVTDEHYAQAVTKKVVQNLVQQDSADDRTEPPEDEENCTSAQGNALVQEKVGVAGFELCRSNIRATTRSYNSLWSSSRSNPDDVGAPDGAPSEPLPAELAELVRCWPTLPPALRAGIMAMVRASEHGT